MDIYKSVATAKSVDAFDEHKVRRARQMQIGKRAESNYRESCKNVVEGL